MATPTHNDEIDLGVLIGKFNSALKSLVKLCFRALDFALKQWLILLILFIAGLVLGYFSQQSAMPNKEASLLIRTNFDTTEYTYDAVEVLKLKAQEGDSIFLTTHGFRVDTTEISDIEIASIMNLKHVSEEFETNFRNLGVVLENIEFEEDYAVPESFVNLYRYHKVKLSMNPVASEETVARFMNFLNNNELINDVWKIQRKNLEDRIAFNEYTIQQIDTIVSNYDKGMSLPSPSSQIFVVDKNFSIPNVLKTKIDLQEENSEFREELAFAKHPVVQINSPIVTVVSGGLLGNKMIAYPILFIFFFLFLAWLRYSYFYLRRLSESE